MHRQHVRIHSFPSCSLPSSSSSALLPPPAVDLPKQQADRQHTQQHKQDDQEHIKGQSPDIPFSSPISLCCAPACPLLQRHACKGEEPQGQDQKEEKELHTVRQHGPIYKLHDIECILVCHYLPYQDIFRFCRTSSHFVDVRAAPLSYQHTMSFVNSSLMLEIAAKKHWLRYTRSLSIIYDMTNALSLLSCFLHFPCLTSLHLYHLGNSIGTEPLFQHKHKDVIRQVFTHLSKKLTTFSISSVVDPSTVEVLQSCLIDELPLLSQLQHLHVGWIGSHFPHIAIEFTPLLQLTSLLSFKYGFYMSQCNASLLRVLLAHSTLQDTNCVPASRPEFEAFKQSRIVQSITQLRVGYPLYTYVTMHDILRYLSLEELSFELLWPSPFGHSIQTYVQAWKVAAEVKQAPLARLRSLEIDGIHLVPSAYHPVIFDLISILAPRECLRLHLRQMRRWKLKRCNRAFAFNFPKLKLNIQYSSSAPVDVSSILRVLSRFMPHLHDLDIQLWDGRDSRGHEQSTQKQLNRAVWTLIQRCTQLQSVTVSSNIDMSSILPCPLTSALRSLVANQAPAQLNKRLSLDVQESGNSSEVKLFINPVS